MSDGPWGSSSGRVWLGQDLCFTETPGLSLDTSAKLQDNDLNLAAFEWSTVQPLAFQLFVMKTK